MIGRKYLADQAKTLLRFSIAVHDPKISNALAAKAADLQEKAAAPEKLEDLRAPGVEPLTHTLKRAD